MRIIAALLLSTALSGTAAAQSGSRPHNVILFVADGLRPGLVSPSLTLNMTALMQRGVTFTNTHSLFPTFTTANASGMATGHLLGDTGDFSNVVYTGFPVTAAAGSSTPFLENDAVLGETDAHFGGDYLAETTVLKAARTAGLSTATIGKLGPALIFDHTARTGEDTVVVDDSTGRPGGIPLSAELQLRMMNASLPLQSPTRGVNGQAGTNETAGTTTANVEQQDFFANVAARAVLPLFKERGKPFVMVFWSRDPDGSQHNQGDSLLRLIPGINGPTSRAAIHNADTDLGTLMTALHEQGLDGETDVILTADHGFSTISKESGTSFAATQGYTGVPARMLPPGFLAVDLAHALAMKLSDPDAKNATVAGTAFPTRGNGLIGEDPANPDIAIAANGGSDLIYLPKADRGLAERVVAALSAQDYTSGLFVDDALGAIPGTLPLSAIGLKGTAVTPVPAIVISFRTFSTGCTDPLTCGVEIADTGLQQGQGMHGSFSRADTSIVMAAAGPDFRTAFTDTAPVSNADIGRTIARLLQLTPADRGTLTGRVMTEAMTGGAMPAVKQDFVQSPPDANGHVTMVAAQVVGQTRYYDAAGYPGATLGLPAK